MKIKFFALAPLAVACGVAFIGANANAAGILSNGTVALGVQDSGALNVGGSSTIYGPSFTSPGSGTVGGTGLRGLFVNGTSGYEATYPGCLCEGWGVAVASLGITGYDGNGLSNLSGGAAVMGTDGAGNGTATTVRTIANASGTPVLEVTHSFHTSASAYLYQVDVTIKNLSGADLGSGATDLRYTRLMDFDTEPTAFNENITIERGGAANLLTTSDDGFEPANPLFATSSLAGCAPVGASFVDCGPADHGARFDFGFAALSGVDDPLTLDVDESMRKFTIFYGAAPDEATADAARLAVGSGVYAYGQTSTDPATGTPITYIFAFGSAGVGAPDPHPTPEPASLALVGLGLAGLGLARRRKTA
jgi:type IV pilus assembly protein PilY1